MAHPLLARVPCLALLAALCSALPSGTAAAQQRPLPPASIDATLGGGYGAGGREVNVRGGFALDATFAARLRRSDRAATVVALAGAVQGLFAHSDVCTIGRHGQCLGDFPSLASVGVLAGRESRGVRRRATWLSVRALAGPGLYWVSAGGPRSRRAIGAQARLDLAAPAGSHLAFVTSLRGALLPNATGAALAVGSVGVGLRLQ